VTHTNSGVYGYYLWVVDANGCTGYDSVTLTIDPLPVVDAGTDLSICAGGNVMIGGAPTGSGGSGTLSYSWDNGGSLDNASIANPTANPASTTNYIVIVTDTATCSSQDTMTVTVDSNPVANAGADQTICSGELIGIGGSPTASGGAGGYSYDWDMGDYLTDSTIANPSATGSSTLNFIVIVTDANSCTDQDTMTLNVNALPIASAGTNQTYCDGNSIAIGGAPTASGGAGGYSYSWDNGSDLDDSTAANPMSSAGTNTNFIVIVTDANSCTDQDTMTVTVNSNPVANAGTDQDHCDGGSTAIGGAPTASGGAGGYTYLWDNGSDLDDSTIANPTANPAATTNFIVVVTDANTCSDQDTMTVTVNANPVADAGANQTICSGDIIGIGGAPTASGGAGGYSYDWDMGDYLSDSTIANPSATGTSSINFIVIVTDANSCVDQDTMTLNVNALPTASAGADQSYCAGSSIAIGGAPTASGGAGGYSYSWDNGGGLDDSTLANPTSNINVTTNFIVVVTDANSCTDEDTMTVTVNANPVADAGTDQTMCAAGSTPIGGAPTASGGTGPYTFGWAPGGMLTDSTIANPSANPGTTTQYIVVVTDANLCTDQDTMNVNVGLTPTANAGPDVEHCFGDNSPLGGSPSATGGTPPYSYSWNNAGDLNNDTIANPTASNSGTKGFILVVTDAIGCSHQDTATVAVNFLPTADAGIDQHICVGSNTVLNGNGVGGTPPYDFIWTSGTNLDDSTLQNPTATLSSPETFTVLVTDSKNCIDTDVMNVTLQALPTANFGADVTSGVVPLSVNFTDSSTTTSGSSFFYQFGTGDTSNIQNPTYNYLTAGSWDVTLTVTDSVGCMDQFTRSGYINPINPTASGLVKLETSGDTVDVGYVLFYKWAKPPTPMELVDSIVIQNNGSFTSSQIPPDTYILFAKPDSASFPNVFPTFYPNGIQWNQADTISLTSDSSGFVILVKELPPPAVGPGKIIGKVVEGNISKKGPGDPLEGVDISLTNQGSGSTVAHTETDSAGEFSFLNLPLGNYSIYINVPGVPVDTNSFQLVSGDTTIDNILVVVDSTEISFDETSGTDPVSVSYEALDLRIRPNPYLGATRISFEMLERERVTLEVYSIIGDRVAVLIDQDLQPGKHQRSFSAVALGQKAGIYLVKLRIGNRMATQKLVELR
jgi:PKD repeat protein